MTSPLLYHKLTSSRFPGIFRVLKSIAHNLAFLNKNSQLVYTLLAHLLWLPWKPLICQDSDPRHWQVFMLEETKNLQTPGRDQGTGVLSKISPTSFIWVARKSWTYGHLSSSFKKQDKTKKPLSGFRWIWGSPWLTLNPNTCVKQTLLHEIKKLVLSS
jgi:hypothetical protein